MLYLDNFLIVGGSGRDVGKTTLCEQIIAKASLENRVIAIKTSNHFHEVDSKSTISLYSDENIRIIEENSDVSNKDTARFLKAGASSAFLVMAKDDYLETAIKILAKIIDLETNIFVVESSFIIRYIIPGVSIFLTEDETSKSSNLYQQMIFVNKTERKDFDTSFLSVIGNKWFGK